VPAMAVADHERVRDELVPVDDRHTGN
jgi:hypothetical protein